MKLWRCPTSARSWARVSLRSRLFLGIAGALIVSLVVTVVVGALLTRRSLEANAVSALERQAGLIAAQRREDPGQGVDDQLGRFLATDEQRLAILTPAQADLLLPDAAAGRLRRDHTASGSVDVRGTRFLFAARESDGEAIVLLRPAASQQADWRPFALGLATAGLVGAALAAAIAFLLARGVARPVARVSAASRALASGEAPSPRSRRQARGRSRRLRRPSTTSPTSCAGHRTRSVRSSYP